MTRATRPPAEEATEPFLLDDTFEVEVVRAFVEWLDEQGLFICRDRGRDPHGWSSNWQELVAELDDADDWARRFGARPRS